MVVFKYKALDTRTKQTKTGTVECASKSEAMNRLKRQRLKVISISVSQGGGDDIESLETPIIGDYVYKDVNGNVQISLGNEAPSLKDIIIFTKQFATMIASGVPMIQALGALAKQQPSRIFMRSLLKIQKTVENGASLSSALAEYPDIFDALYIAMVEAGEASGNLDTILGKLVGYIERSAKIKGQIKSALSYPVLVLIVATGVVTGLLVFVVPVFAQQYSETGRDLPELTQIVIDFSNYFASNWHKIFGIIAGVGIAFRAWLKTTTGRKTFDEYILKFPVIGPLLKKIAVGRFCSTMASMLSSGVNLLEALSICATSSGNKTIENFVMGVRDGVEKGQKFSEPLAEGGLFPDMVVSMVTVGESTGALDDMLKKVSDFYDEEVDLAVAAMLSLIEPFMIVFIGGIIAFIVIAMYLPVFEMAGGI